MSKLINIEKFKNDLLVVKDHLEMSMKDLELKEKEFEKLNSMHLDLENIKIPEFTNIVFTDKTYKTCTSNLLKDKGSLLYFIICRQEFKVEEDSIIIELNQESEGFEIIINYMKYGKLFNQKSVNLNKVLELAEYLSLLKLANIISDLLPPKLIGFTTNGPYQTNYGYNIIGGFDISCVTKEDDDGLTSSTPGWFIFEFNRESYIESIRYRGYCGNSQFSSSNGSNSKLSYSIDGTNFIYLCNLPTFGTSYITFKFKKVKAKFVKVENTSYLGFSFVEFK